MIRIDLSWRKQAISALLASGLFIGLQVSAATSEPPGLLSTLPGKSRAAPPKQAIAGRSRAVRVNHGRLRSGRFFVNLPDGVSFEAVRKARYEHGNGRSAWVGHAAGNARDRVIIGLSGDAMAATFSVGDRLFKLEPRADGTHVVSEVSAADPAPELDPIPVGDTGAPSADSTPAGNASADGGTVIDVLIAYTPKVQSIYGAAGADALAIQAVAETNQAYANSGINPRLNLVAAVLTDYVESGSMSTDLSRLRGTSDGYMDELHTLRDSYGADLVSLIEDEPKYCGLAFLMRSLSTSFASNAFSVVHRTCATGYYSFAHELGHNQGAHHDAANAGRGMYPHAYGYQEPFGDFRTVMAYNCSGGCKRVDYFSNPAVIYQSQPTGILGAADNALTHNKNAATVASFRQSSSPTPPPLPADLNALANSSNAIQLSWADTASDESGFRLQRSATDGNYTDIASLNDNSESYLDDNLAPDTLYSYRLQAWNSAGSSGYSNVASAATETAPPFTEQVASADLAVAGTVSGNYQDTWADDSNYQTIHERLGSDDTGDLYGYLEHKWTLQVVPGDSVTFSAEVEADTLYDAFTFAYSADNNQFINMFSIDRRNPGHHQFMLPAAISGTVYIRVRDHVRSTEDASSYSVKVNQLSIRSENSAALPLSTPSQDLTASTADAESHKRVSTFNSTSSTAYSDSVSAPVLTLGFTGAAVAGEYPQLPVAHQRGRTEVPPAALKTTRKDSAIGLYLLQAARALPKRLVSDGIACSGASQLTTAGSASQRPKDRLLINWLGLCGPDHQFK